VHSILVKDILNIEQLVNDWGGFEQLVAKLHETGEVGVEHNVTLVGSSGAPRQIDVVIRHKQGLYEHLVIAECKYWNDAVDRQQVDTLANTIREVGAARGVIFSKRGFQSGAVTQAKHDHIDLFQVRSLTDEEWGLPGREVEFFMHCHTVSVGNVRLKDVVVVPGSQPKNPNLEIVQGSTHTKIHLAGSNVETIEALIEKYAIKATKDYPLLSPVRFENSFAIDILVRRHVNITPPSPIQLFFNEGYTLVGTVSFDLGHKISQTRVNFDRAKNFHFALAIDDFARKTTTTASRRVDETTTTLAAAREDAERLPPGKAMENGSLLSYWIPCIQPFEEFASLKPGETRYVERGDSKPA
jgi:hypothetical protein